MGMPASSLLACVMHARMHLLPSALFAHPYLHCIIRCGVSAATSGGDKYDVQAGCMYAVRLQVTHMCVASWNQDGACMCLQGPSSLHQTQL